MEEERRLHRLSRHRHVVAVFATLAVAVAILPTFADIAIHDDWVYSRVAYDLAEHGRLRIPVASAVYGIFDGVWGALFSLPFGFSLGTLRFASVVLLAIGALAFYGLALELGARRERAALATAVYIFNPLTFVLAFTYMTDTHVMALLTIAAYFYVCAWKRGCVPGAFCGSGVATLALLSRNQGIVIALGAAAYAIRHRHWRHAAAAAVLPIAVAVGMKLWFTETYQMKEREGQVTTGVRNLEGVWESSVVVLFLLLVYAGLIAIPLFVTARYSVRHGPALGVAYALAVLVLTNGRIGRFAWPARMPFTTDWLNRDGLGPLALVGARAPSPGWIWAVLTPIAIAAALASVWLVFSQRVGLIHWLGAAVVISLLPSGFAFMPPLDRYLIGALPFVLAAVVAARSTRRTTVIGWACAALMALVAFVGTHDFLSLQKATWAFAEDATREGVALTQLDAGGGWTGWQFTFRRPFVNGPPTASWWLGWGSVDSTYIVSLGAAPTGYSPVRSVRFESWVSQPDTLVLSRRDGS